MAIDTEATVLDTATAPTAEAVAPAAVVAVVSSKFSIFFLPGYTNGTKVLESKTKNEKSKKCYVTRALRFTIRGMKNGTVLEGDIKPKTTFLLNYMQKQFTCDPMGP